MLYVLAYSHVQSSIVEWLRWLVVHWPWLSFLFSTIEGTGIDTRILQHFIIVWFLPIWYFNSFHPRDLICSWPDTCWRCIRHVLKTRIISSSTWGGKIQLPDDYFFYYNSNYFQNKTFQIKFHNLYIIYCIIKHKDIDYKKFMNHLCLLLWKRARMLISSCLYKKKRQKTA